MTPFVIVVLPAVILGTAKADQTNRTPNVAQGLRSNAVRCEDKAEQAHGLEILRIATDSGDAAMLTVRVRQDQQRSPAGSILIAAHKVGAREWTIVGAAPAETTRGNQATAIAIRDPRLGNEASELVVLRVAADTTQLPQAVTERSLRRTAAAISPTCRLPALVRDVPKRPTSIEVETIGREPAIEDQERDVRQAVDVGGRVSMNAEDVAQVVVSPLSSNGRWVMHGGSAEHGRWEGLAHLGTTDLGRFERFVIVAVVANPPLPPGHEISPAEWASYRRDRIRALSRQYIVRRTDPAVDGGIALQVTHIREQPVTTGQTYYLGTATTIRGVLAGRKLSAHDSITTWVRPMAQDATWIKVGPPARFQDAESWTVDALVTYPVGQPLLLVAMLANEDVDLNRYRGGSSSLSPTIRVIAGDRPEVAISRINGTLVGPRTEGATLSPDSVIEGTCSGGQDGSSVDLRLVAKNGTVARVARAPCAESGSWRLHFRRPRDLSSGAAQLSADLLPARSDAMDTALPELLATSSAISVVLP